jgi:pyruvate kinase
VKAIIALTESGYTPLIMSRIRSSVPIFAFSPHRETQARAAMFRGVYTVPFDPAALQPAQVSQAAVDELLKRGVVQAGDWVILTKGDSYHTIGSQCAVTHHDGLPTNRNGGLRGARIACRLP